MPKWNSIEAKDRLLAAIVAAHSDKKLLDYRKIATYYGEGATYDSIEGRFRRIRKEAEIMKSEVDAGIRPEAPARGNGLKDETCDTPKKSRKPRGSAKKNETVLTGRITKSVTPTKKRGASTNAVKGVKEEMESSASSMMQDDIAGGQFDLDDDLGWDFPHPEGYDNVVGMMEADLGYGTEV